VRPLPPLQQSRAALFSLSAHGALLALLLLLGRGAGSPAAHAPIIEATLVSFIAREAPAPPSAPLAPEPNPDPLAAEQAPAAVPEPPQPDPAPALRTEPPDPEPALRTEPREPVPTAGEPPAQPSPLPPATPEPEAAPVAPAPAALATTLPPAEPITPEPVPPAPAERAPPTMLEEHVGETVRSQLASWTGRFTADAPTPALEWRADGQRFTAVLTKLPASDPMGMEQLRVEVTTERDGERLATELRMTRVAFSNFAQFIDRWDPNVQIHDDVIDGRFHSNSEIRVSREGGVRPLFNGKVTLAARDVASDGTGFLNRRAMFPAGIETSVRRIVLPPRATALDADAVATERSQRIARDARLTFHADGSYDWQHLDGGARGRGTLDDEPFYVLADDGANLEVSGTVNGKVLVYSPATIVVTDDLRYAEDPRSPGASDFLGLVAERTVEVDEPQVTGPGDLEIHASIYARQRFQVRAYRSRASGTLRIHGSVTAGSVSATEPRFATKIEFDDRLTTLRAPGFPLSDRYELDSWNGEWRVLQTD
jgi:hypothetical protein